MGFKPKDLRQAICKVEESATEVANSMQLIGDKLILIQALLDHLAEAAGGPDIPKLQRRLARIREHINMMELVSFKFEIDRTMEDTWRRLP